MLSFLAVLVLLTAEVAYSSSSPLAGSHSIHLRDSGSLPVFSRDANQEFPEQWFTQPLDHFSESPDTFRQRFWVSTRHYKPGSGGPVIVLDGGETSGEDRLPFLDTGIVNILAKATGGVGVVLEHRYYGSSIPVANFSTDSLRWLNSAQALADSANFMKNVKFAGLNEDLTAPKTRWIYYGGSYAGARAAHMRVVYPDLVFGAIASSAVVHATSGFWEYYDVIRQNADPRCMALLEGIVRTADDMLASPNSSAFKDLFGLGGLVHDEDFMAILADFLNYWQGKNWDPNLDGGPYFDFFCDQIKTTANGTVETPTEQKVPYGDESRMSKAPNGLVLDQAVLSYAKHIKSNWPTRCPEGSTVEDCFGTSNDTEYLDTALDNIYRPWTFQQCTEQGFFTISPSDPSQPRITSRLETLEHATKICRQAFPPGQYFSVPSTPNVTAINMLGDYAIAADRLAFIDGEYDVWRPATPHSSYAKNREDTILRPFKLIPKGGHHYEENGLANFEDEPEEIKKIHKEIIAFVKEWLKEPVEKFNETA